MKFSPLDRPLILAHRGDTSSGRENSVQAIASARRIGADGIEIDVRMTVDGHLVLAHDPDVMGRPISETPLDRLRELAEIDLLKEGLAEAWDLFVDLEIKGPVEGLQQIVGSLAKAIESWPPGRVLISSFWPQILVEARNVIPDAFFGILTSAGFDSDGTAALNSAVASSFDFILPASVSVNERLINDAHSSGLAVIAWTENGSERFGALDGWGIDGVITDRPAELLAVR